MPFVTFCYKLSLYRYRTTDFSDSITSNWPFHHDSRSISDKKIHFLPKSVTFFIGTFSRNQKLVLLINEKYLRFAQPRENAKTRKVISKIVQSWDFIVINKIHIFWHRNFYKIFPNHNRFNLVSIFTNFFLWKTFVQYSELERHFGDFCNRKKCTESTILLCFLIFFFILNAFIHKKI